MASRTRKIYIDRINRKAYSSLTSKITQTIVDFFVADEEILQLIAVEPNPDITSELQFINDDIVGALYAALGITGQVATAGDALLTDPVSGQVAAGIAWNVTDSAFQALLRTSLATNYGVCVVTQNGPGDYYVDRVTKGPIASALTGDGTDLFPACFVNVIPVRVGVVAVGANPGTSDVFRVVFNQQPAAYTDRGWIPLPDAAVTVTQIVAGSDSRNAVFRVSINPDAYQGSFYLTSTTLGSGNTDTATSLPIDFESTDVGMQSQIIAGWGTGNEVTVTEVNGFTWDVEFTGTNLALKDLVAFTGDATGLSVPIGLQGVLDLRTEAANAMVQGIPNKNVYFQVKNDDGSSPQTWLYVSCTLNPTLISPQVLGSSNIAFPLTKAAGDLRYVRSGGSYSGFTGGVGKLDSIVTIGSAATSLLIASVSDTQYLYQLVTGTATDGAPEQVTPIDATTSGFYLQLVGEFPTGPFVTSVAGRSGIVTLSTTDIAGLGTAATHAATDFDAAGAAATAQANAEAFASPRTWLVKTANYTAVAGDRIQADVTGGTFTIILPPAPAIGDAIEIEDAAQLWGSTSLTIARNGLKINSGTANFGANVSGMKLSIVYVNVTIGWSIK